MPPDRSIQLKATGWTLRHGTENMVALTLCLTKMPCHANGSIAQEPSLMREVDETPDSAQVWMVDLSLEQATSSAGVMADRYSNGEH